MSDSDHTQFLDFEEYPQIPDVTITGEIGRGGMGVVYKGKQTFLDREVAVKVLGDISQKGEAFAKRFQREAKILAGMTHANIVGCYQAGTTHDGQSFIVMEFIDGPNLQERIEEHGKLTPNQAIQLCRDVALALAHAHESNIIHRDVKPENVLLKRSTNKVSEFPFEVKLADLGLARSTESDPSNPNITQQGQVFGTPSTMAPEQFDDPDGVDHRADIYGLGCVIYHSVTGQVAYAGSTLREIITRKSASYTPKPSHADSSVPGPVCKLVTEMLAYDRDKRPRTYEELIQRCDRTLQELDTRSCANGGKSKLMPLLGVTGLVAVMILVATIIFSDPGPKEPDSNTENQNTAQNGSSAGKGNQDKENNQKDKLVEGNTGKTGGNENSKIGSKDDNKDDDKDPENNGEKLTQQNPVPQKVFRKKSVQLLIGSTDSAVATKSSPIELEFKLEEALASQPNVPLQALTFDLDLTSISLSERQTVSISLEELLASQEEEVKKKDAKPLEIRWKANATDQHSLDISQSGALGIRFDLPEARQEYTVNVEGEIAGDENHPGWAIKLPLKIQAIDDPPVLTTVPLEFKEVQVKDEISLSVPVQDQDTPQGDLVYTWKGLQEGTILSTADQAQAKFMIPEKKPRLPFIRQFEVTVSDGTSVRKKVVEHWFSEKGFSWFGEQATFNDLFDLKGLRFAPSLVGWGMRTKGSNWSFKHEKGKNPQLSGNCPLGFGSKSTILPKENWGLTGFFIPEESDNDTLPVKMGLKLQVDRNRGLEVVLEPTAGKAKEEFHFDAKAFQTQCDQNYSEWKRSQSSKSFSGRMDENSPFFFEILHENGKYTLRWGTEDQLQEEIVLTVSASDTEGSAIPAPLLSLFIDSGKGCFCNFKLRSIK